MYTVQDIVWYMSRVVCMDMYNSMYSTLYMYTVFFSCSGPVTAGILSYASANYYIARVDAQTTHKQRKW